jgi:serine-type D-Ala-D-Ala carboxypeptidase (penicillin-binding protein 5/6)
MRTRRAVAVGATVIAALFTVAPAAVAGPPVAPPECPYARAPGPPVDESEALRPGQSPPPPLPVPAQPVGGPAMGWCGVVVHRDAPAPPAVGVASYVLADLDTGAVLAAHDAHARLRPASLMKTLTGLLAARDLPMDEVLTGTQVDADQEGTRVGLGPGGRYPVRDLLEAMLMASGNDAAHALAVRHSGSAEAMVAAMNRTAADMGALDTRAATPSGLDGPGMQTSAYDLASIFRAGMAEPEFARATGTRQIVLPGYPGHPPTPVSNDNKLLRFYAGAIGGKTGFTDDARHTYIGAAQRGGRRLVVVLMRGEQRPVPMYAQGAALLDYGFSRPTEQAIGRLTEAAPRAAADDAGGTASPAAARAAPAEGGGIDWRIALTVAVVAVAGLAIVGIRLRDRS